ncbi:MAG: hypothetical protein IMZ63_01835 [Actinobacteria bacterium]|nr:hypothetical protein [Actinomycetota bacterium]
MVQKKKKEELFDRLTISMSQSDSQILHLLSKKEGRKISNQITFMMNYYIEKNDIKKD